MSFLGFPQSAVEVHADLAVAVYLAMVHDFRTYRIVHRDISPFRVNDLRAVRNNYREFTATA